MKFNSKIHKKKRRNNLKKDNFKRELAFSTVKNQIKEEFSLYKLGKIEWAKEHASANRPMKKLAEFTKKTNFCNCCNLPCETPGIIERFSWCENTENFNICGKAVPLYFYYFRYCIYCLIVVSFIMSIPMTIFNNYNLQEIEKYCLYKNEDSIFVNENETFCKKYSFGQNNTVTNLVDWFWKVSSDNINDYKELLKINNNSNIDFDKIFVNFSFVGFYCMISLFIINIYFMILFKAKIKGEKNALVHPSDYTLLITDLKKLVNQFKENNNEKKLYSINNNMKEKLTEAITSYEFDNNQIGEFTQFLKDNIFYSNKSKTNFNIFNLNLCYKLNEFMILKEKEEKCKYEIFQVEKNPYQIEKNHINNYINDNRRYYKSPFTYIGLKWLYCSNNGIPLNELYKEQDTYEQKLNLLVNKAKLDTFCGCVFASFNTIKEKDEFYNNYPHFFIEHIYFHIKHLRYYFCCCFYDKNNIDKIRTRERISVYLAPEPEDVIWENMEFTAFQRFYRIFIFYSLTILLITLAFFVVDQLTYLQQEIKKKKISILIKYSGSFSITIIIAILNKILQFIMKYFTKMEKQKSNTYYYLSYSIKLTIFTFITSALLPFLSNYLIRNDKSTLITNMLFLFLGNSLVEPILWTINVPFIIKKIRIYLIERKKVPNENHFKTQKELNDLYEYPDMDIASKYSYIYKTLLMAMFYLSIFPLGVPISLMGFVFGYFLEKFNFTHSYRKPEMLNEKLGEFYFNFFNCIFVSFSIGNYVFMNKTFNIDNWKIINIIFFSILSIIPYTKPIAYYFNSSKDFEVNSKPISDIYFSFYNDYQRQNPFTKKEGMYFYVKELKKKGYVSKFLYDILIKNIEKINVMEIYYNTSRKPYLKESQSVLATINKNFNMDDLRKSLLRIFRQREQNANIKSESFKSDFSSISISTKSEEKQKEESKNLNEIISCNSNNTINIEKNDDELIDYKISKRNSDIQKSKKSSISTDNENNCLTEAFTNKDNFLINQYKNPLLLNIGLGIKSLTFVDKDNYFERITKQYKLSKIPSISSEEENNLNEIIEEKKEEDDDNKTEEPE